MKVYWTHFAENKLEDINNFYKFKAGAAVALQIIKGIVDSTSALAQNPEIGQQEELLSSRSSSFRYLVFKNYKIIYFVDQINKVVIIANVFDTRQNPEKINQFE